MSGAPCGWWGYVKNMIRRWPDGVNENERRAIQAAMEETLRMKNGRDRLAMVDMVLIRGTHKVAGAALEIPCSEHTAQRYHAEFIRAVGRNFSCSGLE